LACVHSRRSDSAIVLWRRRGHIERKANANSNPERNGHGEAD